MGLGSSERGHVRNPSPTKRRPAPRLASWRPIVAKYRDVHHLLRPHRLRASQVWPVHDAFDHDHARFDGNIVKRHGVYIVVREHVNHHCAVPTGPVIRHFEPNARLAAEGYRPRRLVMGEDEVEDAVAGFEGGGLELWPPGRQLVEAANGIAES